MTVGSMDASADVGDSPDVLAFSASLILTGREWLPKKRRKGKDCKANGREVGKFLDASSEMDNDGGAWFGGTRVGDTRNPMNGGTA